MKMNIDFPGGKRVNSDYKGFTIQTDQPKDEGGDNTAPEPFDIFLASIGTCAGIYVLSFCQERNIQTRGLKLTLGFDRNDDTHMVEKINIKITVPDDFPEKYKSAVIKTAGLCTVKKHFASPPEFDIHVSPKNELRK